MNKGIQVQQKAGPSIEGSLLRLIDEFGKEEIAEYLHLTKEELHALTHQEKQMGDKTKGLILELTDNRVYQQDAETQEQGGTESHGPPKVLRDSCSTSDPAFGITPHLPKEDKEVKSQNTEDVVTLEPPTSISREEFLQLTTEEREEVRLCAIMSLVKTHGTQKAVALSVGISAKNISRILKKNYRLSNKVCAIFFQKTNNFVFLRTTEEQSCYRGTGNSITYWPALDETIEECRVSDTTPKEAGVTNQHTISVEKETIKAPEEAEEGDTLPEVTLATFLAMSTEERKVLRKNQCTAYIQQHKTQIEAAKVLGCERTLFNSLKRENKKLSNKLLILLWEKTKNFIFLKTKQEKEGVRKVTLQKTMDWPDLDSYEPDIFLLEAHTSEPTQAQSQDSGNGEAENEHIIEEQGPKTEAVSQEKSSNLVRKEKLKFWMEGFKTKKAAAAVLKIKTSSLMKYFRQKQEIFPQTAAKLYHILKDVDFLWTAEEKAAYRKKALLPDARYWPDRISDDQVYVPETIEDTGQTNNETIVRTCVKKELPKQEKVQKLPETSDTKTVEQDQVIVNSTVTPHAIHDTAPETQTSAEMYKMGHIAASLLFLQEDHTRIVPFLAQIQGLLPPPPPTDIPLVPKEELLAQVKSFFEEAAEEKDIRAFIDFADIFKDIIRKTALLEKRSRGRVKFREQLAFISKDLYVSFSLMKLDYPSDFQEFVEQTELISKLTT